MNKTWACLAVFAGISLFPVNAAFYEETPRYQAVPPSAALQMYVDTSSVKSVVYEPPLYIIEANIVYRDLTSGLITVSREMYFYNSEKHTIFVKNQSSHAADEEGNTSAAAPISLGMKLPVKPDSEEHTAANLVFRQLYQITFDEESNQAAPKADVAPGQTETKTAEKTVPPAEPKL